MSQPSALEGAKRVEGPRLYAPHYAEWLRYGRTEYRSNKYFGVRSVTPLRSYAGTYLGHLLCELGLDISTAVGYWKELSAPLSPTPTSRDIPMPKHLFLRDTHSVGVSSCLATAWRATLTDMSGDQV